MILSDTTLRAALAAGRIRIDPLDPTAIQPASIDLRLSNEFRRFTATGEIDPKTCVDYTKPVTADPSGFVLRPGEFALGATLETVAVGPDLVARIEGKSSLGRLGLLIHATAGFIDPGFDGTITLELANLTGLPIRLYPQMRIGQLSVIELTEPVTNPYGSTVLGSKYQGQAGPRPSEYFRNFRG